VLVDGRLPVPTGPGLGVNVDLDYLGEITYSTETVEAERRAVRSVQ
jgi:hypothetical protein